MHKARAELGWSGGEADVLQVRKRHSSRQMCLEADGAMLPPPCMPSNTVLLTLFTDFATGCSIEIGVLAGIAAAGGGCCRYGIPTMPRWLRLPVQQ